MIRATVLLVCSGAVVGSTRGQDADSVGKALEASKKKYDASEDKFHEAVMKRLQDAENGATRSGKKKLLEQVEADREAFHRDGTLPKSVGISDLSSKRKAARRAMIAAYEKAIEGYVKKRMRAEADAIEEELNEFKGSDDAYAAGSQWIGENNRKVPGEPETKGDVELNVLTRVDKRFTARVQMGPAVFVATGTIDQGRIEWKGKDTKADRGMPRHDYSGQLNGEEVTLSFSGVVAADGRTPVSGTVVLGLVKRK